MSPSTPLPSTGVRLFWLPLGAGGHCVRVSGRTFEAVVAGYGRRERCALYHSALEVSLHGARYVVEMAPVWATPGPDRGVVAEGPVGLPLLGHSRLFRYEVRRWRDGVIPDAGYAVQSPLLLSEDAGRSERLLALVPAFPAMTWGLDEQRVGEMWNSNSLVSWLLVRSGHDVSTVPFPEGGRAPGWSAGLAVAGASGAAHAEAAEVQADSRPWGEGSSRLDDPGRRFKPTRRG